MGQPGITTATVVQRSILFDLKDEIVPPTNETVTQVFARLSAYRDAMDGPQVNSTPVFLACDLYPLAHNIMVSQINSTLAPLACDVC